MNRTGVMCRPCAEKLKEQGQVKIDTSIKEKGTCDYCKRRRFLYNVEYLNTDDIENERVLILPIKREWFEKIISGEKKEEYREIKPYWTKRFYFEDLIFKDDTPENPHRCKTVSYECDVLFRNGYSLSSPSCKCRVNIHKGYGKTEWGAEKGKEYYVLDILKILEVQNR